MSRPGRRPPGVGTALFLTLALAGCASTGEPVSRPAASVQAPAPPPVVSAAEAPAITRAADAPLAQGPAVDSLNLTPDNARAALAAFRLSCSRVIARADTSGLTRPADWAAACAAAPGWPDRDPIGFFAAHLETVRVGDGQLFATGYYEPEIAGSRTRAAGYEVPVYRVPSDLVSVELGAFSDELKGRTVRGRWTGKTLEPYPDRAAIEDGALAGRGLEIAWAADPVELFFLEVQGSGRLRLPDGGVMRIGYAGQNGRGYTAIGRLLRQRNLLPPGGADMKGIMAWIRANPAEGKALMRENKSVVFFRELTGPGPLGALNVPVTPRASVAADPAFVPLGAPVWLAPERAEARGLWVAQDTGGAIKGANRVDTFWGAGEEARAIAGGMSSRGEMLLMLPKGTFQRLQAAGGTAARS